MHVRFITVLHDGSDPLYRMSQQATYSHTIRTSVYAKTNLVPDLGDYPRPYDIRSEWLLI
jgi:hypothetical protein